MDLFGFKEKREKRHLEFLGSLHDKDDKYLYDTYCTLDMDVICGSKNKYLNKEILAVVDELEKRGYVNELGQVYPSKVDKNLKSDINDFIEKLKIKSDTDILSIYNDEKINPLSISSTQGKLKFKAIEDELKNRGYMTSIGILTYPISIKYNNLKEWNVDKLGFIDNIQFNGYEVFITGESKILRIYGEEDDCGETSIKLGYVDEALEREELQYIEMNSELADIDVCTLSATLKFTDGSSVCLSFNQINEDEEDYSLDNLKIEATYLAK